MKNLPFLLLCVLAPSLAFGEPRVVVIDPGHGGSSTGAPTRAAGRYEKHVTLQIARALKARLEQEGVRVVLTRDRDQYVTIRERSRRANREAADCFISLHANASPDHARQGVETFVLARESTDVEARRAAERARPTDPLDGRLADLRLLETHHSSMRLARAVQTRLAQAQGAVSRGVRQAPYDVLAGVEAPAILVEVGFLDHPIEGARLLRADVERRAADAIAEGVVDFFGRSQYAER